MAKTHRDYFVQMDRQAVNVACAVERAKAHGIEWLLHVDDDEMLHCPARGWCEQTRAVSALPARCCDAHIKNLEALAPAAFLFAALRGVRHVRCFDVQVRFLYEWGRSSSASARPGEGSRPAPF